MTALRRLLQQYITETWYGVGRGKKYRETAKVGKRRLMLVQHQRGEAYEGVCSV